MWDGSRGRWPSSGEYAVLLFAVLAVVVPSSVAGEPSMAQTGLTINEYMRCPEPPSDSVLTLEPDGAAKITVMRGMDRRTARTLVNYKRLSGAEMEELATLLRSSDFDRMPDVPRGGTPRPSLSRHPCLITTEIHLDGKVARLRYDSDPDTFSPAKTLAGRIHAILDRHEWKENVPK